MRFNFFSSLMCLIWSWCIVLWAQRCCSQFKCCSEFFSHAGSLRRKNKASTKNDVISWKHNDDFMSSDWRVKTIMRTGCSPSTYNNIWIFYSPHHSDLNDCLQAISESYCQKAELFRSCASFDSLAQQVCYLLLVSQRLFFSLVLFCFFEICWLISSYISTLFRFVF